MSYKRAREVLGVSVLGDQDEIRRAYLAAAKRAHPDSTDGDAQRFREVVEAYERLRERRGADRIFQPPAPPKPARPAARPGVLEISPRTAQAGGPVEHILEDGRRLRITLPPGLRMGDTVRAGAIELVVFVRNDRTIMVRGDDLWISVDVDPGLLAEGGRIAVETPLGRRVVWITRKAGERGLVRLPGQGLPARGARRQGHLFLRLTPLQGQTDSAARTLLRRFAAAWAA